MKITLGPAGTPSGSSLTAPIEVKKLGLGAMELAFGHGVNMKNETAKKIAKANEETKIRISIHAPYHINLASEDSKKKEVSKKRILDTCERGHYMGAEKVVFHPAYYGNTSKKDVFLKVKEAVLEMMDTIHENQWNIKLAPETTGRIAQFGTLEEIVRLSRETKCSFCIDISHIYARNMGEINYDYIFGLLRRTKKKEIHFHFSCIDFGSGGERRHLILAKQKPDFGEFAKYLLKQKIDAIIISESPVTWQDSLKMKTILKRMGYRLKDQL